jgi:RNA polymerase sigma-70 factor (ECF subfamily)
LNVHPDPSDQDLIAEALEGKNAAFSALMRRHKGWLYRFVRRYVRDPEESYDVVQESFVSAWSALSRYDPARPFDVWLRRIALNKCRDRARKEAVRRHLFRQKGASTEETEAIVDTGHSADETARAHGALKRLETAIAALPRTLREPLILTALEGLSHSEAGRVLNINPKAVEMRVYRARKQLAGALDPADLGDLSGA